MKIRLGAYVTIAVFAIVGDLRMEWRPEATLMAEGMKVVDRTVTPGA